LSEIIPLLISYHVPDGTREEYTKDYSTDDALLNYPLQRLAPIFHGGDLVVVNCEGALSDHGRQVGLNRPALDRAASAVTKLLSRISVIGL
jgi:hypothetical protein